MSELAVGSLAGLASNSYVIDVASGSQLTQPGMTLAVESALKTDTFSSSVSGKGSVAVTDLSITHTMANASNKLLIMAYFGVAGNSHGFGNVGIAVADDGTLIGVGTGVGDRIAVAAGGLVSSSSATHVVAMPHIHLLYSPGDTSSHTYTVRAFNIRGDTQTLYVNRSVRDGTTDSRGASAITIQEVAG